MTDRIVDTDQIVALTVDDGVEGDGGLSGLAVADDQLALAPPDRDHAVDGLQAGGHRFADWLTVNDAGGQTLQRDEFVRRDRTSVVDRLSKRVHHPADHGVADRHAHDSTGALDLVAFLDFGVFPEQHHADLVLFQVHCNPGDTVGKRQELAGHDFVESVHARDTVAESDDGAGLVDGDRGFVVLDLFAN